MYTNPLAIALYKKNIEMISFLLITCKADENLALVIINFLIILLLGSN